MNHSFPLISIVIPAYNGSAYLPAAIESALSQTHRNIEVIVGDDCSQDNTVAVIESFDDRRMRFFKNEVNLGLTSNLNRLIEASRGDYVCWLNQDDIFYAGKLERQLEAIQNNPKIGACFCEKDDIDSDGRLVQRYNPSQERIPLRNQLLQLFGGCYLTATSVMIPRRVLKAVGGFNNCFQIAFDFDMWFRIRQHYEFYVIDQPLIAFRHHSANLSGEINSEVVNLEAAAVVSNALRNLEIEQIFPVLCQSANTQALPSKRASCFLILARLIWSQKSWSHFLVAETLALTAEALRLNTDLLGAYSLAKEISQFMQNATAAKEYERKWQLKCADYQKGIHRLNRLVRDQDLAGIGDQSEKLIRMSPGSGDPYYQLAGLQAEVGQLENARENCRKALSLNPDHQTARHLLAELDAQYSNLG